MANLIGVNFDKPITRIIQERRSWRTFENRPIHKATLAALSDAVADLPAGPFGGRVRLALIETAAVGGGGTQKLGTYGVIKDAPTFLAGAVRMGDRAVEDYGYVFELAILKATDLGLQTCWLGGTLKRGRFGERLRASDGEIVPAVSPVGYARQRRSLVDVTFRTFAGSKNRKPWQELFFDGSFIKPLSPGDAGETTRLLEMVRLAPSASNNQPWRIVRDRDHRSFHLYLARTVGYANLFPVDLQKLDMGIAMCHFTLTARELGVKGEWRDSPPDAGPLPERTSYVASFGI